MRKGFLGGVYVFSALAIAYIITRYDLFMILTVLTVSYLGYCIYKEHKIDLGQAEHFNNLKDAYDYIDELENKIRELESEDVDDGK